MRQNKEILWHFKPVPDENDIKKLATTLFKVPDESHLAISALLLQRKISSFDKAKVFFAHDIQNLHDPFIMKGMQTAVDRILLAIERGENILIYGDYDVDGTCAVSLMYNFLSEIYPNVSYYIPCRYQEGYGVSFKGIDFASDNDISLIITLDCGIKSADKIQYAQEKGIEVIICDHHTPDENLPCAVAILNPKQSDCPYPYKELCGCGIGFKLSQAICTQMGWGQQKAYQNLDLVALATSADIVPMTGENRLLTYFGLEKIRQSPCDALRLLQQFTGEVKSVTDLVFKIAPRINAAGRIKHGSLAVALFTSKSLDEIGTLCQEVENLNAERKNIDETITQLALKQIEDYQEQENFTSVVYDKGWHKGVIGIVASRLIETYYRPTLVFTDNGGVMFASARSVKGFDVYKVLEACQEHLIQFGGHQYAAGLSLKPENYKAFKQSFEEEVKRTIAPELLKNRIEIDLEIPLSLVTEKFLATLNRFSPYGPQNLTPVFVSKGVIDKGSKQIGKGKEHLKLLISEEGSLTQYEAVAFFMGDKLAEVQRNQPFNIVYTIEENIWQNKRSIQLMIKDIRF